MQCEGYKKDETLSYIHQKKSDLTMCCGCFMSDNVAQHCTTRLRRARRTWTRFIYRVHIGSVFLEAYCSFRVVRYVSNLRHKDSRRLTAPLCVNATPNRAVRVGKTQSACSVTSSHEFKKKGVCPYHIDTECHTNQKVCVLVSCQQAMVCLYSYLLQIQFPLNIEALSKA